MHFIHVYVKVKSVKNVLEVLHLLSNVHEYSHYKQKMRNPQVHKWFKVGQITFLFLEIWENAVKEQQFINFDKTRAINLELSS